MGRVSLFCFLVASNLLLAAGSAWGQAEEKPPDISVGRDSAGQIVVKGSPTEPLTPAKERIGALEVLNDTQGVDFGPYLKDVLKTVRENWYRLIPKEAQAPILKKGKLAIEFAVKKDSKVAGMKLVASSGDVALDRAAWAGIAATDPLPSLPVEFKGDQLPLRFRFSCNPDAADLAPGETETAPPVIHALAQTVPEKPPDHGTSSIDAAPPTLCFPQPKTQTRVDGEVVNKQQGVSLAPYLEDSVLPVVRANWYRLVSRSAGREGGQLTVEFGIQKDGKLRPAKVTDFSENAGLGELALQGIENSGPFPALPADFSGESLGVRSHFHYDPDNSARVPSRGAGNAANRGAIFPICNPNQPTQNKRDCLSPPRVIFHPDPIFSPEARQSKYQGTVMLSAIVAADGSVQSACAMHSLGYGLDKQAVDAVRRWKFEPATLEGKPMAAEIMIEVDFHLYDKADEPTSIK